MGETKRVEKLAVVMSEVMNIAAMVRRGDDAAWAGIGPDAHERIVSELRKFADLASFAEDVEGGPVSLTDAALRANALADEIMRTGIPVSSHAQELAGAFFASVGVGEELLNALDGEA